MSDGRRLVSSSVAAKELGVHYSALPRWVKEGKVVPTATTPGGHMRWNMDDLRQQLKRSRARHTLEPLSMALDEAVAQIEQAEDEDEALELATRLHALTRSAHTRAGRLRDAIVTRIYESRALDLKPLAEHINISTARAARNEQESP